MIYFINRYAKLFIIFFVILIILFYYFYIILNLHNKPTHNKPTHNKYTRHQQQINNLFNQVKIYRFGINNTKVDFNKCINLLNTIINISDDVNTQKAYMILNDIQNEIQNNTSNNTSNNTLINTTNNKWFWPHLSPKNNKFTYYEKSVRDNNNNFFVNLSETRRDSFGIFVNENEIKLQEILLENIKNKSHTHNTKLNVFDNPEILNDKQNVHDHIVVRSITQSLNNLNTNPTTNLNDNLEATSEFINFKNSLNTETQITLNKILTNTQKISSYNLSEYEIFVKVWNAILNNIHKQELLNILKQQLIDSNKMCSMGRANRIIQTLEGFDDNISIKPEWAILTEMNNKALKIFNDLIIKYPNALQDDTNNENIKNEYKNLLLLQFESYKNLLSDEYITVKINEYLQAF